MEKLKQGHGNWVEDERFWDREDELKLFIQHLEEGSHIRLLAQRRIGKTSLMREAARRLADRYVCLHVDLQDSMTAEDAVSELGVAMRPHAGLWQKTKRLFRNIARAAGDKLDSLELRQLKVNLRAGVTPGDWARKGDQLFSVAAACKRPVIMFFDEVPILVNRLLKGHDYAVTAEGRRQTDAFISWLRENAIRHKGSVRIVLTGSIGFEPILRQVGLTAAMTVFPPLELQPWDGGTAIGCLTALANEYGIVFDNEAAEEMVRLLGCCIPHHVQMFFTYVYEACSKQGEKVCNVKCVQEVYRKEMLGTRGQAELLHYEVRLKMVLDSEELPLAMDLLTESAVTGCLTSEALEAFCHEYKFEGRDVPEVEREILDVLEHDGYLRAGSKGYVFVSSLLRDWWKARYEHFFTPVLKR